MDDFSALDYVYMARAMRLAAKGRYTTPPNPNVGCVFVKNQQIIGEGFHSKAGQGHAEVNAMADARAKGYSLEGSTCYVTLEPCCHYGRTPPCAQALSDAKVARVVMAMRDPNPKVAGGGKSMLEQAGITVQTGLLATQAEQLNPGFLLRMRLGRPRVRLKIAISLDGRTALANGQSQWITGALARSDVQRERAVSHAILSTAQTVLADNASLNVRVNELGSLAEQLAVPLRQPIRVIIDRRQQLSGNEPLFRLSGRVIRVIDRPATHTVGETLLVKQCDNWLEKVLYALAQLEINDLWVEAGATMSGALLSAGLVDELIVYQAAVTLGDQARAMLQLDDLTELSAAKRWVLTSQCQVGHDLKFVYQPKEAIL
ncbi:bifunctional diaminohydroxyphosphoribosylaminopyrimidine deaminase/5-amino-6-(5-phosphoribosylamino)uracil reductase RibD [Celerinatantimonas diazotrophica]|uniref:Riboflavin biosynthesis protein RibD n=1 Tax=Celerinatantimonas diazotrophica TaxID=412034 RepID=A0A4R1K3M3_9GAMM|nr:bifunctional diaminohydroxyphosphoribosylaminopyrimidine deaminase/5-amino-6-(5-phosphoribosylamino)uracil reductase RibD [Celerinatantimonas diazotrophica]TCK58696.1 diaminohydroxyphosphoribosylaminopyrimidine deaminase [Celerinatantimonas diazotrophica]CAG9297325.1 Riboflavin biosynthesis protein RibD [Celerinatantimonas diazotrophica]